MKKMVITTVAAAAVLVAGAARAQDAAKGQQVYTDQKCSMCHSIDGKGNPKGSLDGVGSKFTAAELREWLTDPAGMATKHKADRKPAMPTKYASLPKADLDNLVAYLSSLKKK